MGRLKKQSSRVLLCANLAIMSLVNGFYNTFLRRTSTFVATFVVVRVRGVGRNVAAWLYKLRIPRIQMLSIDPTLSGLGYVRVFSG